MNLDYEKLETFFIEHLHKIYCAKSHLLTRLPQILSYIHFPDLKETMVTSIESLRMELSRMDLIYALIEEGYSDCAIEGLARFIEDAFSAIERQNADRRLRDMSILFYLQIIESVEMASFQMLQMAAVRLANRQIGLLLKENYEQAKSNRTLLLLVASKYITSG